VTNETRRIDIETLARFDPLSLLSTDQLNELAEQTRVELLPTAARLFSEGETDNRAIYLLKGEVALDYSKTGERKIVSAATDESTQALPQIQPRHCTATALGDVEVVHIDRDLLDTLLTLADMSHLEPEVVMSGQGIIHHR